jgi:hypothetical protein
LSDRAVPVWRCTKCGYENFPFGCNKYDFPIVGSRDVKCENCGNIDEDIEWLDTETKALMVRKQKGLLDGTQPNKTEELIQRIKVLEESRNADRAEIKLIRQTLDDLIQNQLQKIREAASDRDQQLANVSGRVKELEDWREGVDDREHGR